MTHTPGPRGVLRGKESVIVYIPFRGSEDELSSFISLHNGAPYMLEALEEVVAITENLPVCPFCGAVKGVQSHRPDCLSHEIEAAIKKARGEDV